MRAPGAFSSPSTTSSRYFVRPSHAADAFGYLLASQKILEGLVGEPTAPVATEAGSHEQIMGHRSYRYELTSSHNIRTQENRPWARF
jgi:hypothetical protein